MTLNVSLDIKWNRDVWCDTDVLSDIRWNRGVWCDTDVWLDIRWNQGCGVTLTCGLTLGGIEVVA